MVAMADGFAQARAAAALVNLHSAIGVGHALGSIFTAFRNQTPLLITAGQQARSILPFEPFLYSEQAVNLPRPSVKGSCEPARAEDVPQAIARAYYTAMQPPRGPTFVSVPVDELGSALRRARRARVQWSPVAADPALLACAQRRPSNAARHPVIVVGAALARDGASARPLRWPNGTEDTGVGGAGTRHATVFRNGIDCSRASCLRIAPPSVPSGLHGRRLHPGAGRTGVHLSRRGSRPAPSSRCSAGAADRQSVRRRLGAGGAWRSSHS